MVIGPFSTATGICGHAGLIYSQWALCFLLVILTKGDDVSLSYWYEMTSKRITRQKAKWHPYGFSWRLWRRFSVERSTQAARKFLEENHINVSARGQHTSVPRRSREKRIPPIPIESLDDHLGEHNFIRGATFFGPAGDYLDRLVSCHPDMRWWISEKGLNVAVIPPEDSELSSFDQLAGRLTKENWEHGRLSREALFEIAKALDQASYVLKKELQPAQWRAIAQHNNKASRNPIKTFLEAAEKRNFVRFIRRRLYLARARFETAQLRARSRSL